MIKRSQSECQTGADGSGLYFVGYYKNSIMAINRTKKTKEKDPAAVAYKEAEKDMEKDPELSDPDPTDDLDEGELARKDNSDEKAEDQMQK
jgi:hypothetical protein